MDVEEPGPLLGQSRRRQFRAEVRRRARENARIGLRRVLHLPAQRGIACIRVDESFLQPVETQPEQQVFAYERNGFHAVRP